MQKDQSSHTSPEKHKKQKRKKKSGRKQKSSSSSSSNSSSSESEEVVQERQAKMVRVPQLYKTPLEQFIEARSRDEEEIKRRYTVIISKAVAVSLRIPYSCHSQDQANFYYPFDKTFYVNPYSVLVPEEQLKEYYAEQIEAPCRWLRTDKMVETERQECERLTRLEEQVWLNRVPAKTLRKRRADEAALRLTEQQAVECPVRKRRVEEMNTEEIYTYLRHHVQYQDASLVDVAQILSRVNNPIQDATNRFIKIVVCGGTGLGKSQVMYEIMRLCALEKGRDKCFIELNFSTCQEKGHANLIVGSPPSYIGHGEPTLVDHLIDALEEITERTRREAEEDKKKEEVSSGDEEEEEEEEKKEAKEEEERRKRHKIIGLHINELDKGNLSMFTALNDFLDRGTLTSVTGRVFTLPADVFIVMCASSNFAEEHFKQLSDEECVGRDTQRARDAINQAMRDKHLPECDITRLGRCVPFFPIVYEQAKTILCAKLHAFIAQGGHVMPSIKAAMHMDAATQTDFIDYMMQGHYRRSEGIRPLENRMKEELEDNLSTQREFLTRFLDDFVPRPLDGRPTLRFECIRYRAGLTAGVILEHNAWMQQRDPDNIFIAARITSCLDQQCDVAFFVLEHPSLRERRCGIHVLTPMRRSSSSSSTTERREITESEELVRVREILAMNLTADERMDMIDRFLNAPPLLLPVVARTQSPPKEEEMSDSDEGDGDAEESVSTSHSNASKNTRQRQQKEEIVSVTAGGGSSSPVKRKKKKQQQQQQQHKKTQDDRHSSSSSDQPTKSTKRKSRDDTPTENTAASKKQKTTTKQQRIRKQEIEGFAWHGVVHGHSHYECDKCSELVDKRRVKNHKCHSTVEQQ